MSSHVFAALAQVTESETGHNVRSSAGNVIFLCVFLLLVICVAIWWLRR